MSESDAACLLAQSLGHTHTHGRLALRAQVRQDHVLELLDQPRQRRRDGPLHADGVVDDSILLGCGASSTTAESAEPREIWAILFW